MTQSITLEDLNDTVSRITKLVTGIRDRLYPNGKPDWMTQREWDNINGIGDDEDEHSI